MKVYLVDELPKSCKDCFFCEHIEENIDCKGRDEVACYFEGFLNNVLLGETFNAKNCKHLQSLPDHDKQVRKEVVQDLCNEIEFIWGIHQEITITHIRDILRSYAERIEKGK